MVRYLICFNFILFSLLLDKSLASYGDLKADIRINPMHIYQKDVCHYTQDLLEIEIGKTNISTSEDPIFQFYARMSQIQTDPSGLSYRWMVNPPEGSMISQQPISAYRLNLKPDIWGTYHITLAMQDPSGHCQYAVYVFQYPEMDHEDVDLLPSIHARSPWQDTL